MPSRSLTEHFVDMSCAVYAEQEGFSPAVRLAPDLCASVLRDGRRREEERERQAAEEAARSQQAEEYARLGSEAIRATQEAQAV